MPKEESIHNLDLPVPRGRQYNDKRMLDPGVCTRHNRPNLETGEMIHEDAPWCMTCHMIAARKLHEDHIVNHTSHHDRLTELEDRVAQLEFLLNSCLDRVEALEPHYEVNDVEADTR